MSLYEDCTTQEIQACIDLYNEPFDFGCGEIKNKSRDWEYPYYNHELESRELDYLISGLDDYKFEYEDISKNDNRNRAWRRKKNWSKAIKKKSLENNKNYLTSTNSNLKCMNKNKPVRICSDYISLKTNPNSKKFATFQYARRNWKHSDKKKIDEMNYEIYEYEYPYEDSREYWIEYFYKKRQLDAECGYNEVWEEYLEQTKE